MKVLFLKIPEDGKKKKSNSPLLTTQFVCPLARWCGQLENALSPMSTPVYGGFPEKRNKKVPLE